MSEIVCVVCCSEPGSPRLAIHTPHLTNSKILRLQFNSDTELEDWIAHLTSGILSYYIMQPLFLLNYHLQINIINVIFSDLPNE